MAANAIYIKNYKTEIPGMLCDHEIWRFPKIRSVNALGRETEWAIYVKLIKGPNNFVKILDEYFLNNAMDNEIQGWIKVDSGVVGGKVKKSEHTIVKNGKNIGKISETNVFCQSLRDAFSVYNKQLKKSTNSENTNRYPPMLSQVLKDQKTSLKIDANHKVYVQRKYNGVRTVTFMESDKVLMYSRRKLLYPGFPYIKNELKKVLHEYWKDNRQLYLDGEIYKHGVALQDISGQARKDSDEAIGEQYDYMIYDCFIANEPNLKYEERKKILDHIFVNHNFIFAKKVETFEVSSMQDIDDYYKDFVNNQFEGAMVRLNETYRYSYNEYHSKYLLKIKPVYDIELEICNWTTGDKGKAADAIMIICKTSDNKIFPVTPAMELIDRISLAKKMITIEENGKTHFENHWKGKKIIITYDELSKDKVPQRARTKLQIRTWD